MKRLAILLALALTASPALAAKLSCEQLKARIQAKIEAITRRIADELEVVGLINVQFAIQDGEIFVIEANPRASRTVPFVAKATGVPLAKIAARVAAGATLDVLREEGLILERRSHSYHAVKEAVLPFSRFPEADSVLGPEMRSTGEVMGIDSSVALAFAKSQLAAGTELPLSGLVFLSVADRDKVESEEIASSLAAMGFEIAATSGTAAYLRDRGISIATEVEKVNEETGFVQPARAGRVDAVELIESGRVKLVINTPRGAGPRVDGYRIRSSAQRARVACITTIEAALAATRAIEALRARPLGVKPLQEYHLGLR